jgi:diguanylate cyclase (GGDEF)-like protein
MRFFPALRTEHTLTLVLCVAFLVMTAIAAVPFMSAFWTRAHQEDLRQSQRKIEFFTELISLIKDAETGQRGFAITGNEEFLEPYHAALTRLDLMLPNLPAVPENAGPEGEAVERIERFGRLKLDDMAASIALRRSEGFAEVQAVVLTGRGKSYMDQVRAAVGELIQQENAHREALRLDLNRRNARSARFGMVATALNMLLLAVTLFFLFRTLRERQQIARSFESSSEHLHANVQELELRNREISLIGQMARALESQISLKEAFGIIGVFYSRLLPGTSGVLYLFRNSEDPLEKEAQWGAPQVAEACIPTDACWALRRGQPHLPPHSSDLLCAHYGDNARSTPRLCLPVMAQGEVLGLILIEASEGQGPAADLLDPRIGDLAISISEQVALALSNARLRKVLREQLILDPLTGLFNRRYMEQTLRREIARARRTSSALSVIVLDIDHFKRINDSTGHEAGDTVLRAFGQQLLGSVRESDAACRFGGEEFVLILPDCSKQAAVEKARHIAAGLRTMALDYNGTALGRVTASIGVACFPEDATTPEALVQAADQAMHCGKENGRNRVVAAGEQAPLAPPGLAA